MVPLIGEIFKKNGIDIIEDPEAWDLYMPLHKYIVEDDLADLKDAKGRVVLGIKGCISYSDRILLWTNAVNMFGREHAIKLMPETFVLSCEQDLELMTAKYPEDAFILKTNGVHNRDGLLVVNGAAEVIRQKDHYAIAQRLITDLVKFNDTVFNLRAFLLLSIKDGMLTSYFFNDALCIWAESATAETDLHHKVVTNPGIQVPEGHPAFLSQLCALKNINYDNLFKDITSKLNDLTKSLLPFIGGLKNLEEAHSLKLFGVDIMIKKNHEPLICEINNYPSMGTKDSYQRDLKTKMVEDLLSLGGIRKQENQGFIKIMEHTQ